MTRFMKLLGLVLALALFMLCIRNLALAQPSPLAAPSARVASGRTRGAVTRPQAPFPPLSARHQQYLDRVLAYWEQSSAQVKRYRCKFTRWEYDAVFGPRQAAKTIATGIVQYAAPDKGMYEVQAIYDYKAPEQPGGKPQYVKREQAAGEKWICDGRSVFEFDYPRKRLIERPLPPEMQGKSIVDGPLPFLFGAKAEKIKQRYWARVITPEGTQHEYWLQAWPKTRPDARNFKKVEVIIAEKDFLPKAIQLFDPNYDPQTNPSRTAFEFTQREINFIDLKDLDALQLFHRAFHRPKTPKGWTREILKF